MIHYKKVFLVLVFTRNISLCLQECISLCLQKIFPCVYRKYLDLFTKYFLFITEKTSLCLQKISPCIYKKYFLVFKQDISLCLHKIFPCVYLVMMRPAGTLELYLSLRFMFGTVVVGVVEVSVLKIRVVLKE